MLELNKIYNMDAIKGIKQIDSDKIDLVVTSPPYDNLRNYKGYIFNFKAIAKELFRVTKNGGVVVWIVGDATINGSETGTSFKQALFFKEIGFNLYDTMIWAKTKMPQNHNRYEQGFEYMFVFSKGTPKTFNGIRDKQNVEAGATAHASYRDKDGIVKKTSSFNKTKIAEFGLRTNIWNIHPALGSNDRNEHPAPFPEKLAEDHILSWSNEGDLVLDPMCGSGTTCKMALLNKRNYIGIEISKEYCEISEKRLKVCEDKIKEQTKQVKL
jgi:site-specific DNA-methyltransferase (adenine-specific)